ncbi:MAG: PEP-CTERM sorting domain-containing protein, partial [Planctomycetes bacterium]|nr:PEP-CTERM sorting domain-containing protein [Planctomycetota bacterium]
ADVAGLYQAGAGGGYRSLGALTMAAGTTLRLNAAGTGQADFASITAGNGATIQGSATLLGEMAIGSSPGTLNVVGSFAMAAGSTYHWEHDGTTGDRVAVSGSPGTVNVNSAWNLGISLAGPLSGPYDLITFPWTAIPPTVGAVNVLKENSWAQLISSATVGADNDSVFVNLTLAANSTWTSNVLGQINWQTPTNWAGGVPNLTTAAIVQAPTATQIATILAGDTGQAQMLIIANNGTVQVNGGGTLQVGSGGIYVDPTGTLRLDEGSTLDVARVNVTGGTLTGPNWPPSRRATLDPATTVRVAGGTLAGGLNLANPSTTPGSYALEAESGGGPATLYGPTASLRKSTAGAATFSGEVNLNSIRVEAGSLTFAHGPALTANTVEVAGGSLQSNKNATIGTLRLSGGTTTLTRATTVTNALQGSATLIADGSFDLDLSSAMIDFTGTLRVANTSPATSGNLLVVLPSGGPPSGALAHWTFDNASNLGADRMNRYNGTLMGTTPPQPAAGRIGGAIDFEQANAQYIDLPDGMANFNTGITVAAWMNYESFTNWNRIIDFGNGAGVDNIVFARQGTSANLRWEFFNTVGGTETHDINTGQFVNSQWMHIAATVRDRDGNPATANDSDSIIYLNGVAFPTKTDHSLPRNITRVNNYIGESNWGGDDFLDGLMDELFVYNRPLSATEVQALYNAGVAGSYAGTGLTPGLGNLRLDPSSRITLGGAGVATFESVGATDGLTINRGLTLGPAGGAPARVEGTNTGVHFDAAIAATSFEVTGAGTVSLGNNSSLTVASGGTLSVPQGTSLSTSGNVTVDASQGSVSYKGGLNVASGTLTLNAPGGAALPSGAIARWTFDNAANLGRDSAGSYNGTLMGSTPPAQAQGMIGGAIDFERDFGNFVDLPDGFANFTTGITVAAWVKYESYTTWNRIIDFGNGAPSNNILLARQGTSANLRWELFGTAGGTETQDVNTGQFINGQWLHIVATVAPGGTNTSVSTIYVNGVPVSVKGDSTLPPNVTRVNNYIGESNWGGDDFLDGLMDELVIYNRTLNATEVQNLYRAGIQGGYGAARFGDLSMAPATRLVAATQPVGFSSATLGDGAILTGDITLDRRLTVAGAATVNGPGGNDGDLRISDGLAYDWSFRRGGSDLMTILGDLHFDSSFTLRIFGEGGTILPTDYVPIFLYSGILEVAGGANPLQYTIEIGNLSDPDNLYIWDATNAELIAGLHEGQQGIWLHGLFAQPVPEPGTLGVLALGVLALLRRRRRRG